MKSMTARVHASNPQAARSDHAVSAAAAKDCGPVCVAACGETAPWHAALEKWTIRSSFGASFAHFSMERLLYGRLQDSRLDRYTHILRQLWHRTSLRRNPRAPAISSFVQHRQRHS